MKYVSPADLLAVHTYKLYGGGRIRGAKTRAKYSRQKQQDDKDLAEWNGDDAHSTETERYRHQHIGVKPVGKNNSFQQPYWFSTIGISGNTRSLPY